MSHYHYDFEKEAIKGKFLSALLGGAKDLAGRGAGAALDFGKKMVSPGTQAYQAAKATGKSTARALGEATKDQAIAAGKVMGDAGTAVYNNPKAQAAGKKVTETLSPVTSRVGRVGQFTTDVSRNALNMGEEAVARMRGQTLPHGPGGLGDRLISPTAANPSSLRNVGVGSGVLYGGARAMGLTGGSNDPQDSFYTPVAPGTANTAPMNAPPLINRITGGGGFLDGIPKEMQYAAAAGVPLALLGAYMGGGKGLATGALGLGALGLGAAGSGYFGDGARRMVGQGANSLMGLFGGNQNGDMMSQIEQLSNLSPEFGVTMLMGKNPGLTREDAEQMYQFLTQNKGVISKMAPMITGAQTPMAKAGALLALSSELEKAARCWKGYEPVPGKAPYTDGSCRPIGSGKKKKKTTEKKSAAPAWQRSAGKNEEGGLNEKGRKSYEREHGGNLKAPVTQKNPKGEAKKRQNSFCSRMCGMKEHETGSKTKKDPDSRINKSLRKWNCKCAADNQLNDTLNHERFSMLTPYEFGRALVKNAASPFNANNVLTSNPSGGATGMPSPSTMSLANPATHNVAMQAKPMINTGLQPKPAQPAAPRAPAPQGNPGLMTGTSQTGLRWDMSNAPVGPKPVGSTPTPTMSLTRNNGHVTTPTIGVSGGTPGAFTPVTSPNTPTIAPVSTFKDRARYAPKPAATPAATPAAKPEMTADDYSSQAKRLLAELNARRRTAGGEVADAGKINQQVNELLGRANKMRNAPGYKPGAGEQNIAQVQQLNADRARAGGEVANVGQRMQAINNASRNYDTASWNRATQGIPQRMPVGNPSRAPMNGPPVQGGPVQVAKR